MSRLDLEGAVVVITGGAGGIGLAVAREASSRGAVCALLDLDGAAARRAAQRLGGLGIAADVTDLGELEAAVGAVVEQLGGIDVLIANAGIGPQSTMVDAGDRDHQRRVLDVNLHGVWHTMWAGAPHVVERRGHIVIVSSVAAFIPSPAWAAYGASKAAVEALGRAMRIELAPTSATVGIAHFGFIDTPLVADFAADALTAKLEALAPGLVRNRATASAAATAMVDGIERRKPRTVFPGPWMGWYLARGLLGPLADAILIRDPRLRTVLEEVRDRDLAPHREGAEV